MTGSVSVALCTYNGAQYLPDLLGSLVAQRRRPDELVVCDDCSSDDTARILRRFAATSPFAVRVEVNARRLGVTANFDRCIGLCSSDLIALADQDDVWKPEKLDRLATALQQDPAVGLVFTDAELVDEVLRPIGRGLWAAIRFDRGEQQRVATSHALAILLRHPVVTGATVLFRAAYRELISPIPASWTHDGWIALLIAAVGRLQALPVRLVLYRQHGRNQIGVPAPLWRRVAQLSRDQSRRAIARTAEALLDARERLSGTARHLHPNALAQLEEALGHVRTRAALPVSRWDRVPVVVREVLSGRYHRYSDGPVRVLQDLLL